MKRMVIWAVPIFILLFIFSLSLSAIAEAKVLPQAKKSIPASNSKAKISVGASIGISPRLRADRRALNVSFSNLQNASALSYLLTYTSNNQSEGAGGSLNLDGSTSQSSELLFGTCSKNVCRYHAGIKNAKLEVNYTLKSGKKLIKRYRIRV